MIIKKKRRKLVRQILCIFLNVLIFFSQDTILFAAENVSSSQNQESMTLSDMIDEDSRNTDSPEDEQSELMENDSEEEQPEMQNESKEEHSEIKDKVEENSTDKKEDTDTSQIQKLPDSSASMNEEIGNNEEQEQEQKQDVEDDAEQTKSDSTDADVEEKQTKEENGVEIQQELDDPQFGRENGYISEEISEASPFSVRAQYVHDSKFDNYTIHDVIDVSKYQGDVDWKKVKQSGIDYAMIRIGYRGYGEKGTINIDEKYENNIKNAISAGIKVGVYFFSQAITEAEAAAEANQVLKWIGENEISLPVTIDFEYASSENGSIGRLYNANLTKEAATNVCRAFCETIKVAGYSPMVYANKHMLENSLDASALAEKYEIWIANYNYVNSYEGGYTFWQYTQNGNVDGIAGNVDKNFWYVDQENIYSEFPNGIGITYSSHIQDIGWQSWRKNGEMSGTSGQAKKLESIKIFNETGISGSVEYCTHVQDYGWQKWKKDGEISGTTGESKRLEAIRIRLTGELKNNYDVCYRVHVQDYGWLNWAKNGDYSGTSGYSKRVEGIQIVLVPKGRTLESELYGIKTQNQSSYIGKITSVLYQTHIEDIGWQSVKKNGEVSGTVGKNKRLEAIKIKIQNNTYGGGISYQTHVQDYGWQEWKSDDALSGTSGKFKRVEAIKIKLTGNIANYYDIYYRTYVENYGWLNWAKNGEIAGTSGYAKRLEAIQIILVEKNDSFDEDYAGIISENKDAHLYPPLSVVYQTHLEDIGWQTDKINGEVSGTVEKNKRLEAIKIKIQNSTYGGGISYQTHVQDYGWQSWQNNGALSGTSGKAKRVEAIKIKLIGEIVNYYDVYYRTYVENYGWLNWAKNGEIAGTSGCSKRLEAIQIILVEKDRSFDEDYAGIKSENRNAHICAPLSIVYQTHLEDIGWQSTKINGETAGTTDKHKRIEAIKISIQNSPYAGGVSYQTHVQDYGWQSWQSNGSLSGTSGKAKRVEAIRIKLTGEIASYYDVYYRGYVQGYGWQNWVSNGEMVGTLGESKRIEAIEICLNEKGENSPGHATIKNYRIVSASADSIMFTLEADVEERVDSDDNNYYIMSVESQGTSYDYEKPIGSVAKTESISIDFLLNRKQYEKMALMNKVALAVMEKGEYKMISNLMNVANPEALAANTKSVYQGTSKKGLQGITYTTRSEEPSGDILDARYTNTKHTLLNLHLEDLVSSTPKAGYEAYYYKGNTYYFAEMLSLRREIESLNGGFKQYLYGNDGTTEVIVSLCLLLGYSEENSYLIDPVARRAGHNYYMLNVREERARETFEALFLYLGEAFGQTDCYVTNWILGNEINSSKAWNYSGNMDFDTYMECYTTAFRLLYNGVKSTKTGNTVSISLDNGWTASPDTYAGKTTLDTFAKKIHAQNPNIRWSIAYHPYSYPLTRVDFWNDYSNTTDSLSTKYISMKNIKVLTDYASTLEKSYGLPINSIRVLLTEQGYSYSGGDENQAMAIARGYYIAQFNDRIDAFIIRSVIDDEDEAEGNLYFGLMNIKQGKRMSFYVYEYMDSDIDKFRNESASGVSDENRTKFNKAKEIVCNTNWSAIIPGYNKEFLAGIK